MPSTLKPILAFQGGDGHRAGEDRFRLLEAIDRSGSIAAAAKAVGLSYKGAWDAVNALNNLFPRPLIIARPGGRHGGGADVTPEGRRALIAHRRLSEKLGAVLADLESSLGADGSAPLSAPALLWSFAMKTSARNTFYGVVSEVKTGAVNAEIALKISDSLTLTAIITNKSALNLGIYPGREAFALIKASAPILMLESEGVRTSARNRLCGTVSSVELGAVNAEVALDLGDGKTLTAIVTNDSAEGLELKPGVRACALIKASQILLGVE